MEILHKFVLSRSIVGTASSWGGIVVQMTCGQSYNPLKTKLGLEGSSRSGGLTPIGVGTQTTRGSVAGSTQPPCVISKGEWWRLDQALILREAQSYTKKGPSADTMPVRRDYTWGSIKLSLGLYGHCIGFFYFSNSSYFEL